MKTKNKLNTRYGHVTYTKLGIRHVALHYFCRDFNIDLRGNIKSAASDGFLKNSHLQDNFVYFLLENKTFIRTYNLDYYSNKSIEIISNKIGRKQEEIKEYMESIDYKLRNRYPYRYISSYKIDFALGTSYNFIKYDRNHIYYGNYEWRRPIGSG